MSGASERANGQTSGLVLTSLFLDDPDHIASLSKQPRKRAAKSRPRAASTKAMESKFPSKKEEAGGERPRGLVVEEGGPSAEASKARECGPASRSAWERPSHFGSTLLGLTRARPSQATSWSLFLVLVVSSLGGPPRVPGVDAQKRRNNI